MRRVRKWLLNQTLNGAHIANLVWTSKGNCQPSLSSATSPTNTVDVVFSGIGKIKVHDHFNVGNVDSTGGNVSCNQNAVTTLIEAIKGLATLAERTVGVDF